MHVLLALVLTGLPPLPEECEPPPLREVAPIKDLANLDGAFSAGLDAVATWCFESSGAWNGGVLAKPGRKGPGPQLPVPDAPAQGDCLKAITSCEGTLETVKNKAPLRELAANALANFDRPYRGQKYTPKLSGLKQTPSQAANCRSRSRTELFQTAQQRMASRGSSPRVSTSPRTTRRGLVLGSLALGRWVDRVARPLRAYALLECATGLTALGVTLALTRLPDGIAVAPLAVRVAAVFALVLAPTFAMGGTLPALVKFATRDLASVGQSFGWLYALNTLGAALGCGLAGFVLIGSVGLTGTAAIAAATNLLGAAIAFVLDTQVEAKAAAAPASAPAQGGSVTALLVAFAGSGFAAIAYEVLWFRVLAGVPLVETPRPFLEYG